MGVRVFSSTSAVLPAYRRRLIFGLCLTGLASAPGCGVNKAAPTHVLPVSARAVRASAAAPASSVIAEPAASAAAHVQSLPQYEQARKLCASKQYSKAADLLVQLSKSPRISPDERVFCTSQANLCRKDAHLAPLAIEDSGSDHKLPNAQRPTVNNASDFGPRSVAEKSAFGD